MPVVVEVILERVTNIAMGTEIDNITEFEDLAEDPAADAPTATSLLDDAREWRRSASGKIGA